MTPTPDGSTMGILVLFVIAAAILLYGLRNPWSRGMTLGGILLVFGLLSMFGSVRAVRMSPQETTVINVRRGAMASSVARSDSAAEKQTRTISLHGDEAPDQPIPTGDVAGQIELFEGTRRSGARLEELPAWAASPGEDYDEMVTLDSGSLANFDECQRPLLEAAQQRLAARLATLHPEAAGWQPDRAAIENSQAVLRRVRETQVVRIDVANSVIREPLCREYWQLSLRPEVVDRLAAVYRPAISRERGTRLAEGIGLLTLLFGAVALGLRATQRPRSGPATA